MTGISLKRKKYNNFEFVDPYTIAVQTSNDLNIWFLVDSITWLWMHRFYWLTREKNNNKYVSTTIFGKKISYHNIIISCPIGYVRDHINQNKFDNRYSNLRIILRGENNFNQKLACTNTSGIQGVSYDKSSKGYTAYLQCQGQNYSIRCRTLEEAQHERLKLEKEFFQFHPIDTPKLIQPNGLLNPYFPFGWYSDNYLGIWWALGIQVIPYPLNFKIPDPEFYAPNPEIVSLIINTLNTANTQAFNVQI